ncbi:MAG: hypothetical protein ABID04_02150 [Patescibacteria group bacterium]
MDIFCDGGNGVNTAIGCVPVDTPNSFVVWLLPTLLGVVGGLAFLLMVYGAIKMMISAGNPQRLKEGQDTLTSAIVGLIFAIFSLFLLRLIGVDILKIPGLQ